MARRDLEHHEQTLLFKWADLAKGKHPELGLLFAVPNYARVSVRYGARMKAEGKRKGVPDVWLPVPRGKHPGLVGEMKVKPNSPTPEQRAWLAALRDEGWCTCVWWSWQEAKTAIVQYLASDSSGVRT